MTGRELIQALLRETQGLDNWLDDEVLICMNVEDEVFVHVIDVEMLRLPQRRPTSAPETRILIVAEDAP